MYDICGGICGISDRCDMLDICGDIFTLIPLRYQPTPLLYALQTLKYNCLGLVTFIFMHFRVTTIGLRIKCGLTLVMLFNVHIGRIGRYGGTFDWGEISLYVHIAF